MSAERERLMAEAGALGNVRANPEMLARFRAARAVDATTDDDAVAIIRNVNPPGEDAVHRMAAAAAIVIARRARCQRHPAPRGQRADRPARGRVRRPPPSDQSLACLRSRPTTTTDEKSETPPRPPPRHRRDDPNHVTYQEGRPQNKLQPHIRQFHLLEVLILQHRFQHQVLLVRRYGSLRHVRNHVRKGHGHALLHFFRIRERRK